MKKIIIAIFSILLCFGTAVAEQIDVIVTGSKTGSTNQVAQLIAKDSEQGHIHGLTLNVISPGDACKGFVLVSQKTDNKPFITHYENFYQLVAKLKNDPTCPYVSFENAKPIVSTVQGLYLVVKNTKKKSIENFSKEILKIGYSSDSEVERGWHGQMNQAFGQDHMFVGYSGSGSLKKGLASEEIDAIWTTYSHFLSLKEIEDNYTIVLRTMDELDVNAPIAAKKFKNEKLTRAFLSTWYVFNDQQDVAKRISKSLEKDYKQKKGNFGAYANQKKLILFFDQKTQLKMEKSLSWAQYQ